MNEKIKILQSVGSLGIGGNEIFVINFFRLIDKSRFQVDFVICNDEKMDFYNEVIGAGSRVFVCKRRFRNKYLQLISQMRQVKKLLRKEHYNIIHCHSCSFVGIFRGAIPGFLTKGTKVVAHAHNVGAPKDNAIDRIGRWIMKRLLSYIVDIGCSCSDKAGESKYTASFIASDRYVIINNAIQTDKYIYNPVKRREVRKRLNVSEDSFVIGNVGRLEEQKNHTFLLDIFNKILEKNSDAVLLLVGDGKLRQSLEKKAEDARIAEHVIFAGQCSNAADYYQAMDCFVLPSHYEGFPFVMVEAQVNGLRCIVSENMTKSVNISGGVQFVPLISEARNWANVIYEFGRQRMTVEEVEAVISRYDLKKEALNLEQIYEKCC